MAEPAKAQEVADACLAVTEASSRRASPTRRSTGCAADAEPPARLAAGERGVWIELLGGFHGGRAVSQT
jgi:hypothetical protein